MRFIVVVLSAIVVLAVGPAHAQTSSRAALMIGNSDDSKVGARPNSGRDAGAMGELFRRIGFDRVDVRTDPGQAGTTVSVAQSRARKRQELRSQAIAVAPAWMASAAPFSAVIAVVRVS